VNDFVQVIRIDDGRIAEVWNDSWDQRALAEALPAAS
jgi:ketosteroid isomerase-like protein